MRRLVLIATCIAALGAGAAVWISGADATVAHTPALRIPPVVRRAPTLRAVPVPQSCYVAGGCSLHPCTQFATSSAAVYQPLPSVTLRSARSRCRPTTGQLQRVGATIVTAQPVK